MKISIDNKEIIVKDSKKNIVEIAEDNGISIVAPCFRNERKNGCCKACIIEVNGERKFACGTKPADGMNIIYKRPDLKESRNEAIAKYINDIKENKASSCACSDNFENKLESIEDNNFCCSSDSGKSTCCN